VGVGPIGLPPPPPLAPSAGGPVRKDGKRDGVGCSINAARHMLIETYANGELKSKPGAAGPGRHPEGPLSLPSLVAKLKQSSNLIFFKDAVLFFTSKASTLLFSFGKWSTMTT